MSKKNRLQSNLIIFELSILLIINVCIVTATQPSLPTTVYGKVYNANMEPAAGIQVVLMWIDADDNAITSATTTLSAWQAEELGDKNLEGYYFFNQGFIKAKLNSEIKIIISGFEFEKINSNPGGIIDVRDAVLASKNSKNKNSGAASSASKSGTESSYDDSQSSESSPGEGGGSSNSQESSGSDYGTEWHPGSESSSGAENFALSPASSTKTSYSDSKSEPTSPTNLFGQIVDENGKPIGDEQVFAEWTDEFNINHTTETRTLSKKEAAALGNKSLEGFYTFNQGDIKAKPNSTISIKTKDSNVTRNVNSKPGEMSPIEKIQLFGESSGKNENIRPIINRVINETGEIFIETVGKQRNNLSILLLLALAVLGSTAYSIRRKKLKQKKYPEEYQFSKKISLLFGAKVKSVMTKNVVIVSKNDALPDALDKIVSENKNSLIVVGKNEPLGVVGESDFVNKVFTQPGCKESFDKLKVEDIMSPTIHSSSDMTVSECIELIVKNNARKLPVVKNGKLVGIITITDLLELFSDFFSKNIVDSPVMPSVGNAIKNKVTQIKSDATLSEMCDCISKEAADYALVLSSSGGIVTTRDIIDEFYKNPYNFDRLKVGYVVKSPVVFITPGCDIIEANNIMLGKKCRRLPVVFNKKVIGVLSQADLLSSIYLFLSDITKKVARLNKVNKKR